MKFSHYCLLAALFMCGGAFAGNDVLTELKGSAQHLIGKGGQPVAVPMQNWKGQQGAIVLNITPQGWSSATNNTAVFVRATETPNTGFLLYKHGSWDLALSSSVAPKRSTVIVLPRKALWQDGKSHIVILNWNRDKFANIYVDGQLKISQKGKINMPDLLKVTIGTEGSWGNSHPTLLKGYQVYSRALTDAEIKSLSAKK